MLGLCYLWSRCIMKAYYVLVAVLAEQLRALMGSYGVMMATSLMLYGSAFGLLCVVKPQCIGALLF